MRCPTALRLVSVASLVSSLLVALPSCGSDDAVQPAPDAAAPAADAGAPYVPDGYTLTPFLSTEAVHTFAAAGAATEAGKDYLAVIETDRGRLVLDLLESDTPITVNSFVWLALHHFFDGIAFHRVIDGFVAQAGDPNTLGTDRSTWGFGSCGYGFGLEIVPAIQYDGAGVVGMARDMDPNSNGSQFFITLAAAHNLDGQYTIFARMIDGDTVLPSIVRGEPPASPTRMLEVHIVEKAK